MSDTNRATPRAHAPPAHVSAVAQPSSSSRAPPLFVTLASHTPVEALHTPNVQSPSNEVRFSSVLSSVRLSGPVAVNQTPGAVGTSAVPLADAASTMAHTVVPAVLEGTATAVAVPQLSCADAGRASVPTKNSHQPPLLTDVTPFLPLLFVIYSQSRRSVAIVTVDRCRSVMTLARRAHARQFIQLMVSRAIIMPQSSRPIRAAKSEPDDSRGRCPGPYPDSASDP